MRAYVRDTEIFFDIDGAGLVPIGNHMDTRPTAFLIHGGPGGDHSGFKGRYGVLRESMQLVYFDHRGQGRSARGDPKKYTLDENVEDLEALRAYLGIGPIVSIGYSYGGNVALAHAARYPSAVSHLILISTCAHAGYVAKARENVAARGTAEQVASCEDLFAGRLDTPEKLLHYFEVMGPLYAHKYDLAAWKVALARTVLSVEALNRAHGPEGFLRSFDLRPELGSIIAPTLILTGRHDWICPPELSEEMNRLIPRSELRVFEESGHSIANDESDECVKAIAAFVRVGKN